MSPRESFERILRTLSDADCKDRQLGEPYVRVYKLLQHNVLVHAPKILYKYFNDENAHRSIDDLCQGKLYLSSPVDFDDDYDVRPVYDANATEARMRRQITPDNMERTIRFLGQFNPDKESSLRILRKQIKSARGFEALKQAFIEEALENLPGFIERFRNAPRCACFAERYDSDMMWGLYASKHTGFVAGYDTPLRAPKCICDCSVIQNSRCHYSAIPLTLAPVIYKGRTDITDYSDVFGGSTALIPYPTSHLYLALLNATLYKGASWAEEREWRLVTLKCSNASVLTMYASMTPSVLYLGSKISGENQNRLLSFADEQHIPVYREVMSYDSRGNSMQFVVVKA